MIRVKLVRIQSNHQNLRTDEIDGKSFHIPEIGESFSIFSEPLEDKSASARVVVTTPVVTCSYDFGKRHFAFTTKNSIYRLDVTEDKDPLEYRRVITKERASNG